MELPGNLIHFRFRRQRDSGTSKRSFSLRVQPEFQAESARMEGTVEVQSAVAVFDAGKMPGQFVLRRRSRQIDVYQRLPVSQLQADQLHRRATPDQLRLYGSQRRIAGEQILHLNGPLDLPRL